MFLFHSFLIVYIYETCYEFISQNVKFEKLKSYLINLQFQDQFIVYNWPYINICILSESSIKHIKQIKCLWHDQNLLSFLYKTERWEFLLLNFFHDWFGLRRKKVCTTVCTGQFSFCMEIMLLILIERCLYAKPT